VIEDINDELGHAAQRGVERREGLTDGGFHGGDAAGKSVEVALEPVEVGPERGKLFFEAVEESAG
jgi:hypothetical protein